ncbi:hypothetical protein CN587_02345 [Bacillus wiedmannii]|nr:hypothetical protein CN587_02345 [Bacillus wiedmannii]
MKRRVNLKSLFFFDDEFNSTPNKKQVELNCNFNYRNGKLEEESKRVDSMRVSSRGSVLGF